MRVSKVVPVVALALGVLPVASAPAAPAPGKEFCKSASAQELQARGYKNQGQCVKAANEAARQGQPFPPPDDNGGPGGGDEPAAR